MLITDQAQTVIERESGVAFFFKQMALDKLSLLYDLFSRDESSYKLIIDKMKPYILERGKSIVQLDENLKDPKLFSESLLDFKKEVDTMVCTCFKNQVEFQKERDSSFMTFMNEQPLTASHLAKFADIQMTSGLKALSENDAHARLETIVDLFVCLYSRDTFLKCYQRELAIR